MDKQLNRCAIQKKKIVFVKKIIISENKNSSFQQERFGIDLKFLNINNNKNLQIPDYFSFDLYPRVNNPTCHNP
jgi:uncharacterized protein YfdQ (DUF2303 family)